MGSAKRGGKIRALPSAGVYARLHIWATPGGGGSGGAHSTGADARMKAIGERPAELTFLTGRDRWRIEATVAPAHACWLLQILY